MDLLLCPRRHTKHPPHRVTTVRIPLSPAAESLVPGKEWGQDLLLRISFSYQPKGLH